MIVLGLISMLLLTGITVVSAVGMKANSSEEQYGAKSTITTMSGEPNLKISSVMVVTSWPYTEVEISAMIYNEMYNIHVPADQEFDVYFYWDDEEEPFKTHRTSFEYDGGGFVQNVMPYLLQELPDGKSKVRVQVDPPYEGHPRGDIEETEDITDNVYYSDHIKPKSIGIFPTNCCLVKIFSRFPLLQRFLRL